MGKVGRTLIPDNSPPPLRFALRGHFPGLCLDFFLDGFVQVTEVDLTCSRLQDSGAVVQLKWCGKRAGAGEREGGGGGVSLPFFPPTPPFPDRARPIFAWLALFFSRPYCLKAWHRLILTKLFSVASGNHQPIVTYSAYPDVSILLKGREWQKTHLHPTVLFKLIPWTNLNNYKHIIFHFPDIRGSM